MSAAFPALVVLALVVATAYVIGGVLNIPWLYTVATAGVVLTPIPMYLDAAAGDRSPHDIDPRWWAIGSLFLWPVVVPWYISKR